MKNHVCMRGMRTLWIKDEKNAHLDLMVRREHLR